MDNQEMKKHIATYKMLQEIPALKMPCPRCGKQQMNKNMAKNALSRHEDIYICTECGREESVFDYVGQKKPLELWYAVRFLNGEVLPYERKKPGNLKPYPIDTDVTTSERTDSTVDYEKNTDTSGDIGSSSDDSNLGNNGQNSLTDNQGDISHDDGRVPESNDRNENGNNNGMTDEKPSSTVPDHSDDNDSDSSSTSGNDGNKESSETDKSDNTESVTDGIQSGDSVTISSISESTVTVTIGSETVVIPVQTTIFNGRVTKSGVISDSLCGYSIGASVMLYYPEGGSLSGATLTGAYVKADSTRLTVSGDYNGDGSKIVFRINGVRLP